MPTTSHQTKPRRRWWSKLVSMVLIGLIALCAAMFSLSPALPAPQPLSGKTALEGRRALSALRAALGNGSTADVRLTWAQAQALVRLGESARGQERFAIQSGTAGDGQATVSKALPLGLWINATAHVRADKDGMPILYGQIGSVPVPAFLARPIINLGRWWLSRKGVALPPLDKVVQSIKIDPQGLSAKLAVPPDLGLLMALPLTKSAINTIVEASLVEAHYCRLVKQQLGDPETSLSVHVNRAFAGLNKDDSRARLVALAMITGSPELIRLTGKAPKDIKACSLVTADATLLGRRDLARHWAISAALAATLGRESSAIMGLWKEMADSVPGGSGFSYADLAADNAGIIIAQGFVGGRDNPKLRGWLTKADEKALLPIEGLNLPEGLATSTPDPEIVARIEARLAARLPR